MYKQRQRFNHFALAILILFLGINAVRAQQATAPRTLSYQGVLKTTGPTTGTAGNILAGNRLLTVTLYSDANGIQKLWQQAMNIPVDSTGVFNTLLGSDGNPLPDAQTMDRPIWLGLSVDGGSELRPLSQITASAYAINVADNSVTSAKLADGAVTMTKLADSSITASKMAVNYVSSISVNGQPIANAGNGSGTNINIVTGDGVSAIWVPTSNSLMLSSTGGGTLGGKTMFNPNPCGTNTDGFINSNTVSGGCDNHAIAPGSGFATIAGGETNTVRGNFSSIGGGDNNFIDTLTDVSFLGSGLTNMIGTYGGSVLVGDTLVLGGDVLGGGVYNTIKTSLSSIVGGGSNIIDSFAIYSFIGGGESNEITGNSSGFSAIAGGSDHLSVNSNNFIGAGSNNTVTGGKAGIVAGGGNVDSAATSMVGAGQNNVVKPSAGSSFIAAGTNNWVNKSGAFVGTGLSDTVNAYEGVAVGGQYAKIDTNAYYSFIGAGQYNYIGVASQAAVLGGGEYNSISSSAEAAVIVGGNSDTISRSATSSVIGGGAFNYIHAPWTTISGGDTNVVDTLANYSVLSGGRGNHIGQKDSFSFLGGGNNNLIDNQFHHAALVGGEQNAVLSTWSVLGGGLNDTNRSDYGVLAGGAGNLLASARQCEAILGGRGNQIEAEYSSIVGGDSNRIGATSGQGESDFGNIGGGYGNQILNNSYSNIGGGDSNLIFQPSPAPDQDYFATIGGGFRNSTQSRWTTISGGDTNTITTKGNYSVISGGHANLISDSLSTIAGGDSNSVLSPWGFVGGGKQNIAGQFDEDSLTVVVGGKSNVAEEESSAIVGGKGNQSLGTFGFIGGGEKNLIDNENTLFTQYGAIAGGFDNVERSKYNSIIGGDSNLIEDGANYSVVGGGLNDTILTNSANAVIGGGQQNTILANSDHSTIPGGDSLFANGYAQTVVGFHNATSSAVSKATARAGGTIDNPLFIVGNGTITAPRNAFQVSYDGHSTVFDVNGGAGAKAAETIRPSIIGSTYGDNTIVAWGDIQAGPAPGPGVLANANADFGVTSVTHPANGRYDVTLNITDAAGAPKTLGFASITVTVEDGAPSSSNCVFATCTQIGAGNTFTIHLHDTSCGNPNAPFMFKVCGR